MKTIQVINFISHFVIFSTTMYMLFQHYGSSKSELGKQLTKFEYVLVKLGLIFMSMGALWSMAKMSFAPTGRILLNIGLASYLFWNAVKLHRTAFFNKKNINAKKTIDPKGEDYPDEPK